MFECTVIDTVYNAIEMGFIIMCFGVSISMMFHGMSYFINTIFNEGEKE